MSAHNFKDLTGQKFGRLTVIERAPNKFKKTMWRCRCDCKKEIITRSDSLLNGRTKSCGCLQKENANGHTPTHGMSKATIYRKYVSIKNRCLNLKAENFPRYGGRGIKIYPEWIDNFQSFYDYVSALPHFGEKGYSLDRIDNNGNYEPNNLRWADRKTQGRNKRNNVLVEYQDSKMTLAEAAELSNIPYKTLYFRYKQGDRGDKLFRPVR